MRRRAWHVALLVATGLLALLAAAELVALSGNTRIFPAMVGHDHALYMEATSRWLEGGSFYPDWQTVGPFTDADWPILYPPQTLLLFVPFTALPTALWYAIPILVTLWIIVGFRSRPWTWPVMLGLFALWPMHWLAYVYGTPTIWMVAALAAGLRWGWPGALILVKPSLLPFALVGIDGRRWWITAAALLVGGIMLAGMTADWVRSLANLGGAKSGFIYSLENLPLMLVPIVAWLGRSPETKAWVPRWPRRARRGLSGPGAPPVVRPSITPLPGTGADANPRSRPEVASRGPAAGKAGLATCKRQVFSRRDDP